ncbi:MAG: ABC transporter ATP-binding protein, partial [Clostridia bacterium]
SPATEIKMLSGGNMQKVVVAREFTQAARLFIVEQPSRGIDVGAAKFLHERLIALRDAGCAILLISADLDELFKLSDSIAVMYEGQIDAYFPDTTLVTENELGYYMLGVKRQSDEEIGGAYHAS